MFEEEFDDSTHIADYLDIFYKRKVIITLIFLLILFVTVFYTFRAVPVYQSTATMIIDKEQSSSPLTGRRVGYESHYSESLTFNTHFKLILSKAVIQRVIKALNLDDETRNSNKDLEISSLKKLIKRYKQNIKLLLNIENKVPTPREKFNSLINAVKEKVSIEEVEETRLLKIAVKDIDPEQASLIANALAKQYIEFNLSNRVNSSKDTLEWMNNELYHLKKKLEDDEKIFFDFKQKKKVFSIEGKQKMVDQKLSEFNSNYLATRNDRLELDTKIREIQKYSKNNSGLANIRSLIDNQVIENVYTKVKDLEIEYANLSKVYKSKHPKIIQIKEELGKNITRLDDELEKELASLKSKKSVLYSREKVLKETIAEFEQDALNTSGNELEYSILQRNLNTSKHLYDTLLSKIKESDLLKTSDTSNIRLVEDAVASVNPVSPNKKRNIMMGIIIGLAGGVLFALFLDYMDQTIRTEEDVRKYLDIPVLSVVPIADKTVEYGPKS